MYFVAGEIFGAVLCLFMAAPLIIIVASIFVKIDVDRDGEADI